MADSLRPLPVMKRYGKAMTGQGKPQGLVADGSRNTGLDVVDRNPLCFRCGSREISGICQNYGCEGDYTGPRQIDRGHRKLLVRMARARAKAKAVTEGHRGWQARKP